MCDWVAFNACDYYETFKCPLNPLTLFLTQNWHTACFPNYFFHNRIERLWRVVWTAVTSTYYDVLHILEEEGLLDISNTLHIFLVHYVFLPHLCRDLHTFTEGWNHHPPLSSCGSWTCCKTAQIRLRMLRYKLTFFCWTYFDFRQYVL